MKKLFLLGAILFITNAYSQARSELNFGFIGANYEIPIHKDITIAPGASTNTNLDWITFSVKANYYFDSLFGITNTAWDVYGGAGAGFATYNGDDNEDDGFDVALHAGGRWFWNDNWGIYAEIGGGNVQGAAGGIGLTVKL
jgi:hypothetical protein